MASIFYTTRELQELLHVDRTTIYRMADAGRLPGVKVGSQWRFPCRPIDQWLGKHAHAPVAPLETEAAFSLAAALPLECIQLIQDSFADALGVMIVITDLEGRPITRSSNAPGLVRAIESEPAAHARCLQWWAELARRPNLQPSFIRSHLGLLCARAFIRSGSTLCGMVIFGGIAPESWPPSDAEIERIALFLGIERRLIEAHLHETMAMNAAQERRLLDFVQRLADIVTHILGEQPAHGLQPGAALSSIH